MTRRKVEKSPEREELNRFQLCCVRECGGEMYDERFHEWLRR